MSTADVSSDAQAQKTGTVDLRLEVVILPVSDADRAHDWWAWYAPYLDARKHGSTSEEADAAADRYMKEAHGVVVSR